MQATAKPQDVSLPDILFGWWYRIAAPPEVPDEAPLRDRMRVRSGRLTSVIFLMQIIFFVVNLAVLFLSHALFLVPAAATVLVTLVIGVFLNRAGKTTAAGILTITALVVGLTIDFLIIGGLSPFLLPAFDSYIVSEVVAASLLIPWIALPLTLVNCLIVAALITFLPKTPDMALVLHLSPFATYVDPMELQIVVAVVTFLWVSSTYKEMRRANSAEEVSKLTMEVARQQQVLQWEKQRLEQGIQQIISVHTQIANGNLNARVPLDQQNVLWAVAGSLNNLLARLQRWRQDALKLQQNERALQQLLYNIQVARRQGKPLPLYTTGTSLDALILEISKGLPAPCPSGDLPNPDTFPTNGSVNWFDPRLNGSANESDPRLRARRR